jgi:hypothetical protein
MREFSDETLMACADGELPVGEAAEIRRLAAADPVLARRLTVFQATREPLAAYFEPVMNQPLPDALLRRIAEHSGRAPAQRAARHAAGAAEQRSGQPRSGEVLSRVLATLHRLLIGDGGLRVPALAGLAGVALIAVAASSLQSGAPPGATGPLVARIGADLVPGPELAAVLKGRPAGDVVRTPAGGMVVTATFRDHGGAVCREFAATASENTTGVACHAEGSDGGWRVVLQISTAQPAAAFAATAGGIAPASGGGAAEYEAAINALREGDVLDSAAEAKILSGWQHTAP